MVLKLWSLPMILYFGARFSLYLPQSSLRRRLCCTAQNPNAKHVFFDSKNTWYFRVASLLYRDFDFFSVNQICREHQWIFRSKEGMVCPSIFVWRPTLDVEWCVKDQININMILIVMFRVWNKSSLEPLDKQSNRCYPKHSLGHKLPTHVTISALWCPALRITSSILL